MMIAREQARWIRGSFPLSISVPVIFAIAALYPAIWNPSDVINRVGLTIIVIVVLWLAVGIRRLVLNATAAAVNRQAEHIRDLAIAEIAASDEAEWAALTEKILDGHTGWLEDEQKP